MKVTELYDLLAEEIKDIHNSEKPTRTQLDKADAVKGLAKQMFNGMDIVVRAEKLLGERDKNRKSVLDEYL